MTMFMFVFQTNDTTIDFLSSLNLTISLRHTGGNFKNDHRYKISSASAAINVYKPVEDYQ